MSWNDEKEEVERILEIDEEILIIDENSLDAWINKCNQAGQVYGLRLKLKRKNLDSQVRSELIKLVISKGETWSVNWDSFFPEDFKKIFKEVERVKTGVPNKLFKLIEEASKRNKLKTEEKIL